MKLDVKSGWGGTPEERRKALLAGVLGVLALGAAIYATNALTGGSSSDTATAPAPVAATPAGTARRADAPAARRISSADLDPTLHPEAMQLAETFSYRGSGRNIFAPPGLEPAALPRIPKPISPARTTPVPPPAPLPYQPPPIDLKYFGIATYRDGRREAFFLQGEDVYIARQGDLIKRRYQVGQITPRDAEVTDTSTSQTQRLPLQLQ